MEGALVVSATQRFVYVLKGHDTSRAVSEMNWALAPEGSRFHEFNPFTGLCK